MYFGLVIVPEMNRTRTINRISKLGRIESYTILSETGLKEEGFWSRSRRSLALGVSVTPWGDSKRIVFASGQGSDELFSSCAQLSDLQELQADISPVTDRGVKYLSGSQLELLSLKLSEVTDKSLEFCAKMPQLKRLDLSGTAVTEKAVKDFSARFPNITIEHCTWTESQRRVAVKLCENGIAVFPNDGEAQCDICDLTQNITLSEDDLRELLLSLQPLALSLEVPAARLDQVIDLPNLKALNFSSEVETDIQWGRATKSLTVLTGEATPKEWAKILNSLPKHVRLQHVMIIFSGMGEDPKSVERCLKVLSQQSDLESLTIHRSIPTAAAFKSLQSLQKLKRLDLYGGPFKAFREIARLPSLQYLGLCCGADWDQLAQLTESKSLRVIHFEQSVPDIWQVMRLHSMRQLKVVSWVPDGDFGMADWFFKELRDANENWEKVVDADNEKLLALADGNSTQFEYLKELRQFRRGAPDCVFRNLSSLDSAIEIVGEK